MTEVRQAVGDDRDAIATFIAQVYGARAKYKGPARWTWQFVDNPFASQRNGTLPIWIAEDDGRVVGQIAVQEAVLQMQGQELPAGWILDVMILSSHRGQGLGHRLYGAIARDVPVLVTLTMAEATRRMAERLDCVTVGEVHQLTRWVKLDSDTVLRYLMIRTATHRRARLLVRLGCRVGRLHRLLPLIANPLLALRDAILPPPVPGAVTTIDEVLSFGPEIDELWERTRGGYPVIFPRDTRFLNWRFVRCPGLRYRCFVARRDGDAVGYVVLRDPDPAELAEGHIVDLYAARDDSRTIEDLLRHSLTFFGDRVAVIDTATSLPEYAAIFRRHGFFRTRTHRPTCVCAEDALRERVRASSDGWFFSKADHDWDQIHDADALAAGDGWA